MTIHAAGISGIVHGATGADESIFTIPADRTYYVATEGVDNNTGTIDNPLNTLQEALNRAANDHFSGRHVKIIMKPGRYYHQSPAVYSPSTYTLAYLIIEAQDPGTAIITGSQAWPAAEWQPYNADTYRHTWPYDFGTHEGNWATYNVNPENPHAHRGEVVFINDYRLIQTLSPDELNNMGPGRMA